MACGGLEAAHKGKHHQTRMAKRAGHTQQTAQASQCGLDKSNLHQERNGKKPVSQPRLSHNSLVSLTIFCGPSRTFHDHWTTLMLSAPQFATWYKRPLLSLFHFYALLARAV